MRSRYITIFLAVLGIAISFSLGFFAKEWFFPSRNFSGELHEGAFRFINPLLECQNSENITELSPFEEILKDALNEAEHREEITSASVYFRDLNNGPWLGIEEDAEFSPASLLKVPVMIAYFKEAEENPAILEKKLTFNPSKDANAIQFFSPREMLERGKEYSVSDLIARMIVYSDNNAKDLLLLNAEDFLEKTYRDLGIAVPGTRGIENFMSVREYARFFRILYNASYLDEYFSNKALELLSRAEFREGLVGGVPSQIGVAHKFGERVIGNTKQLHDCGIVYHPKRPYLLCVMTRGSDFSSMGNAIRAISEKTFSIVSSD